MTSPVVTTTEEPEAVIDPAVERSRRILEGLHDLGVFITNHPEVATEYVSIQMSAAPGSIEAVDALALPLGVAAVDSGGYRQVVASFGRFVSVRVWENLPKCSACGRAV